MSVILSADQITEITSYVNYYRSLNQAPPLSWDTTIQKFSDNWSYHLLETNTFQHSGSDLYGENLAFFQGYGKDTMVLLKLAVDAWYNEISLYDFKKPGFSSATGHFTCLVWKASTNFSIGISIDPITSAADIVMNTSPPGNVEGQYKINVLPVGISPSPSPSPSPVPVPNPVPIPIPVPNPPTPPIPISETAKIIMIINELNNINFAIHSRKPVYFIVNMINNVINEISQLTTISIGNNIISSLIGIINTIQKRKYNQFAINSINNIITQLRMYI
uniref:SCP domain-containing protein n=1 Tax=viral metagenome TaxID=1070528 RepID=A0A6C0JDZ0_9ZZZZ